jgi:hypothetical protein
MKRVKWILVILAVVIIAGAFVTVNIQAKKIKRQEDKISRLILNMEQLLQETVRQSVLIIAQDEVTGRVKHERDSLAKALKIKPKFIEKIIYQTVTVRDTIKVPVISTIISKDVWNISDKGECFKWAGIAKKQGDSLNVTRTNFEYDNKTVQTFYKKAPFLWFIRVGKWKYLQEISAKCGDPKTESITFVKR